MPCWTGDLAAALRVNMNETPILKQMKLKISDLSKEGARGHFDFGIGDRVILKRGDGVEAAIVEGECWHDDFGEISSVFYRVRVQQDGRMLTVSGDELRAR